MIDFLIDTLCQCWPWGVGGAIRREQRRARQRERVFSSTQIAIARHRADEASSGGFDYFADRDGRSSSGD